jgi:FMN phosphatase YigB (HAD superfamily)
VFRPGFDLSHERERRAAAGQPESFGEDDLYPDARSWLAALREQGLLVGLADNQTAKAERILHTLDRPMDVIGTADGWGVEKPSTAFFERIVA